MTRVRNTPIDFDFLFRGMRDKGPKTDEKSPYPRRLVNFDSYGEFCEPRSSLKTSYDFGKKVVEMHVDGEDVFVFTEDELFKATFDYDNRILSTPVSLGTYAVTDYIDVEMFQRETDVLLTGNVVISNDQFIEVGPAGTLNREEWTGKILRLNNGTDTEDVLISLNTDREIEVDGYIEHDYTGGTFEILDTERTLYFTVLGDLYRVEGTVIADTGHDYDHIGIHGGRLFVARNKDFKTADNKVLFTNKGCLYFPRQQEAFVDPADGRFMGFANFFESLVVLMEYGIYTISGQFPEEMIPEKRLSEDVNVRTPKSFVTYNGTMYLLTHRGFEAMNRLETQAQPESRPISYFLNEERFYQENLDDVTAMCIFENRVLVQMRDYVLVHDTDMSTLTGESWFGTYEGFNFSTGYTENNVTFLGVGNTLSFLEPKERNCLDDIGEFDCIVEGNILEYGARDIRKLWRDVVIYQTWRSNNGANHLQELASWGRDVPKEYELRTTDLVDEEHYYTTMESPYMGWCLRMRGDFSLEDITFYFKPGLNYAKSHIA